MESVDEIELAFGRLQARDAKHVAAGREAEASRQPRVAVGSDLRRAVRDQRGVDAVTLLDVFLDDRRHGDRPVREADSEPLARAQQHLREAAPLLALVVVRVVRQDDAQAEQARERREQTRAHGVQVQDVRPLHAGVQHAEQRVHGRLDAPRLVGLQRYVSRMPCHSAGCARAGSRAALHDFDVAAHAREQRIELARVRLDAALHVDDAAQTDHHDAQRAVALLCATGVEMHLRPYDPEAPVDAANALHVALRRELLRDAPPRRFIRPPRTSSSASSATKRSRAASDSTERGGKIQPVSPSATISGMPPMSRDDDRLAEPARLEHGQRRVLVPSDGITTARAAAIARESVRP